MENKKIQKEEISIKEKIEEGVKRKMQSAESHLNSLSIEKRKRMFAIVFGSLGIVIIGKIMLTVIGF